LSSIILLLVLKRQIRHAEVIGVNCHTQGKISVKRQYSNLVKKLKTTENMRKTDHHNQFSQLHSQKRGR